MGSAAVYDVTRALRMFLHSRLMRVSPTAIVTLLAPGETLPDASGVNLYLFHVEESPSTKNGPWPGDRVHRGTDRPVLGLNLSYLLTPLGTVPTDGAYDQGDDAHAMLGAAMLALHDHPIINDIHLPADAGPGSGFDADEVLSAALLDSYESVKVSLLPMSSDTFAKIWSTVTHAYRLSVAYEVTLIELVDPLPDRASGPPVQSPMVRIALPAAPIIDELLPQIGALARVEAGAVVANTIAITGSGFAEIESAPGVTLGRRPLTITRAGARRIDAVLPLDVDGGPANDARVTVRGRHSAASPFVVRPFLASLSRVRTARADDDDATVTLVGEGFDVPPRGVRFDGPAGSATVAVSGISSADRASVVVPPLPNGVYDVRLVNADASWSVTNARLLEIVPLIVPPVIVKPVDNGGIPVDQITVQGARLAGDVVEILLDDVSYVVGPNATPDAVTYVFGRKIVPGTHTLAVIVDGSVSATTELSR